MTISSSYMILALRINAQRLLRIGRWSWQSVSSKRSMLTCRDHLIQPCCQEKFMLACSWMRSLANHGSYYIASKTCSLTPLKFGYRLPNPVGRNLEVYKLMAGENLLVLYSKTFAIRKTSLLATRHYTYTKKTR